MREKGFTLAEVIVTLGIIGVIAAFAIPSFIGNVYNKANATKLASVVADYENIFGMMLVKENKVDLSDTEFGQALTQANIADMNRALAKYAKSPTSMQTMEELGYTAYLAPSLIGAAYAREMQPEEQYEALEARPCEIDHHGTANVVPVGPYPYGNVVPNEIDPNTPGGNTTPTPTPTPNTSSSMIDTGNVYKSISGTNAMFKYYVATRTGSDATVFWDGYTFERTQAAAQTASASCNKRVSNVYIDVNGTKSPNRFGRDVFAFVLGSDGVLYPFGSNTASFLSFASITDARNWKNETSRQDINCSTGNYNGLGCTARLIENNYKMDY